MVFPYKIALYFVSVIMHFVTYMVSVIIASAALLLPLLYFGYQSSWVSEFAIAGYLWIALLLVAVSGVHALFRNPEAHFDSMFLVTLLALVFSIWLSQAGQLLLQLQSDTVVLIQLFLPPFIVAALVFDDSRFWRRVSHTLD